MHKRLTSPQYADPEHTLNRSSFSHSMMNTSRANNSMFLPKPTVSPNMMQQASGTALPTALTNADNNATVSFKGELVNGMPHGQGILEYASGIIFKGTFKNGKKNGHGSLFFPLYNESKEVVYTVVSGEFQEDQLYGPATVDYPNGERYVGLIIEGKPSGLGMYKYSNGDLYDGEWMEGKRHGQGVMRFAAVDDHAEEIYEGEWKHDVFEGIGQYTHSDGSVYSGEWRAGQMSGKGQFRYSNGNIFSGEMLRDEKNGYGVLSYAKGGRYSGNWVNDVAEGHGEVVYEGGEIFSGYFSAGLRSGDGELILANNDKVRGAWYNDKLTKGRVEKANGNVYEGELQNDMVYHGEGVLFDTATKSRFEGMWNNGKRSNGTIYFVDGSYASGTWNDGQLIGELVYTLAVNSVWNDADI